MRVAFDAIDIAARVVIGEGADEPDAVIASGSARLHDHDNTSPRSHRGHPLEAPTCARPAHRCDQRDRDRRRRQFLNAPDTYMQKIAVGPEARA